MAMEKSRFIDVYFPRMGFLKKNSEFEPGPVQRPIHMDQAGHCDRLSVSLFFDGLVHTFIWTTILTFFCVFAIIVQYIYIYTVNQ